MVSRIKKKRLQREQVLAQKRMFRAMRNMGNSVPKLEVKAGVGREISLIILIITIALTVLSIRGNMGVIGTWWQNILLYSIGLWGVWVLIGFCAIIAVCVFFSSSFRINFTKGVGIFLFFLSLLGIMGLSGHIENVEDPIALITGLSGYIGFFTSYVLKASLGEVGTKVVLFGILLIALLLIFQVTLFELLKVPFYKKRTRTEEKKQPQGGASTQDFAIKVSESESSKAKLKKEESTFIIKKPVTEEKKEQTTFKKKEIAQKKEQEWIFPSFELLDSSRSEVVIDEELLKMNAEKIKDKLVQFDIPVTMRDLNVGPTVMQYTLEPPPGVKLSKITSLKNDLALALAAKSIRIEAPIPGKSLVGIEVPNEKRMIVHLREILESKEFFEVKSHLRFPLGRDVSGKPVIDALDSMPHVLIAGSTGSGKSVAINSLLISLFYQNSPRDLKLILVDPKRVELSSYNMLPHLLTPVITDPEKAVNALRWTVGEMTRRYKACQDVGARNRDEYNKKAEEEDKMPYIVFVVDELADLMMTAMKKEVEALICRIAQMARAVGIHLVIATQRPSVDVITGLIKANIPARVAFSVVSSVDSRTIIDGIGAEDLIGKGDMLYVSPSMGRPMRIQGVFVSSDEIERVTTKVRMTIEPDYDDEVVTIKKVDIGNLPAMASVIGGEDLSDDQLVEQAIQVIKENGKASASLFQRRMKLGYARAARIMDVLEEKGIVGPVDGSKPRTINIACDNDEEGENSL